MRRELLSEDVLALRAGTLAFGRREAAQLRSRLTDAMPQLRGDLRSSVVAEHDVTLAEKGNRP